MNIFTYINIYKIVFILAILIAEWLFMRHQPKRRDFYLRLVAGICLFFLIAVLLKDVSNMLQLSAMFLIFSIYTIIFNYFCWKISWKGSIFFAVVGYSMQHIASICQSFISTFLEVYFSAPSVNMYSNAAAHLDFSTVLIFIEVYFIIYYFLYKICYKQISTVPEINIKSNKLLGTAALMILIDIVLNSWLVEQQNIGLSFSFFAYGSIVNLLCSLSVMMTLFGLLSRKSLEDELSTIQELRRQEHQQYLLSKETIDMINIKCHDMKHQIHTLQSNLTADPQLFRELEENIEIYSAIAKTGCEPLDVILTEKSLYCQKNNIQISHIIDGKKLSFMSNMDVYSLFGNLLDNAINSVMKLSEDKRHISLNIKSKERLLSITSQNYYNGELIIQDGRPMTLNPDKRNHGFGTRSMILIVEKYGGTINFDTENNIFTVNILFFLDN